MHLKDLILDRKHFVMTIGEGKIEITYRPSAYTGDLEEELAQMAKEHTAGRIQRHFLSTIVIEWDLVDNDGPVPLTEDGLRKLPTGFLNDVADEIAKDYREGKAQRTSGDGSPPGA